MSDTENLYSHKEYHSHSGPITLGNGSVVWCGGWGAPIIIEESITRITGNYEFIKV